MRTCTKCGTTHPLTFFNKDSTRSDGVYPQCKNCTRGNCRRVYQNDHERRLEKNRAWKRGNAEKHRETTKKWRQGNPEKGRAATNRWRAANPEKARQWQIDNPERVREATKRWKDANRESIRETERRYIASNRGKVRAKNARRRAGVARATPEWADVELMEFIYSECPPGHHVDHVYPLNGKNSCGLHVPWNLQYLPSRVNSAKSNKVPVAQEAW